MKQTKYSCIFITCKPGRAACGKDHKLFLWARANCHLSRAETAIPINAKFWMIDCVGELKRIAHFGWDRIYGASPHMGEIYSFQFSICLTFSSSCFVDQATHHNSQRIWTNDGSKYLIWRINVPLACLNYFRPLLGGDIPYKLAQKPQILKSQRYEQSRITSKQ